MGKISLSFKGDFENDRSKLRILVDSRLENQRMRSFVLTSTIHTLSGGLGREFRAARAVAAKLSQDTALSIRSPPPLRERKEERWTRNISRNINYCHR